MKQSPSIFAHSKIALSLKVMAMLIIILAIYLPDLTFIANEAMHSELMSYMLAIPILFVYLIYRKRKMIQAAITFETPKPTRQVSFEKLNPPKIMEYASQIVGILICLAAFLIYWHGSYTFYAIEYHMISLPIFIAGIITIIFNTKTLQTLAFPISLLVFLAPPPLEILNALGSILSTKSSEIAYTILKTSGLPVDLIRQYGTPVIVLTKPNNVPISFTVDVACAGLYSLIGFIVFATFIAYISKTALPKKAGIFLIGIPLMFALNIIRITTIVLIGNQYGEEIALQVFHLLGGWTLILLGSVLLTTIAEKTFKIQFFAGRQEPTLCHYCNQNQNVKTNPHFCIACGRSLNAAKIKLTKPDIGKILIIVLVAFLVINIQVPVFALTEGPVKLNIRALGGDQTTTQLLPEMPNYKAVFLYRDRTFEEQAQQDAALIYAYYSNDTSKTPIWVVVEVAQTRASMHPWEVCLITWQIAHGYQPSVEQLGQKDVLILDNPPVTARYFSFQDLRTDETEVILYYYESSFFNTGLGLERKYAKISFIAFSNSSNEIPSIENQLLPFGKNMIEHWVPIKSWSLVALLISQNAVLLMVMNATPLALILAYQANRKQKRKNLTLKTFSRLISGQEKLLLDSIHKTAETQAATGNAISQAYKEIGGKNLEPKALHEELTHAEEAGLIRRDIGNRDDEPILVWKTEMPYSRSSKLKKMFIGFSQRFFKHEKKIGNPIHSN